jgi:hypothetical protein
MVSRMVTAVIVAREVFFYEVSAVFNNATM